jgi:hypothetical protein
MSEFKSLTELTSLKNLVESDESLQVRTPYMLGEVSQFNLRHVRSFVENQCRI